MRSWWQKILWIAVSLCGFWAVVLGYVYLTVGRETRGRKPPVVYASSMATPPARDHLAVVAPAKTTAAGDANSGGALIARNDCVACHKTDVKVVGPAYRDIANRYRSDPGAQAKLVGKIRLGGAGSWGEIPMAPHPTLTKQQLDDMVAWILAQKTGEAAPGVAVTVAPPIEIKRPVMGALSFAAIKTILAPGRQTAPRSIAPLASLPEPPKFDPAKADLGRRLFFDPRLSGDATVSCATCHDPDKGFGDGMPLSAGYPGALHFRNAPTLINATLQSRFTWDGRLDGGDPATLVRDMVTEAHTMNIDGRLLQERIKQVPEYVEAWRTIFGDGSDPYGPQVFSLIGEFLKTIRSDNTPFDRHLAGESGALDASALRGLKLFQGRARCIECHNGPLLSDGGFHAMGVPEHPAISREPLRAITMLRHYATFGTPNYMNRRTDLGLYAVTKNERDIGKFRTAPLRELTRTAPYMHNGVLGTLEEVIAFYDGGGGAGAGPNKDPLLQPLDLSAAEKADLLAFLQSLSGNPVTVERPAAPPNYQLRAFGKN